MFSIFKKKQSDTVDLSALGADMHSHVLPGIDDGSPDTNVSAELIGGLKDLGYQQLITTPHINWDVYKNTPETIEASHNQLRMSLNDSSQLPVRYAAEYYMDDYFDDLLRKGVPLLPIHKNWVLVEFSFLVMPMDIKDKIFELQIKGYQPVLAHPERYTYLAGKKDFYDKMKSAGCLFQVNLLSFTKYYGKVQNELAAYLLKKNYIDLLGTDLHHVRHLEALRNAPILNTVSKQLLDTGKLLNPTISF